MSTIHYVTLAAARRADKTAFDNAIKYAFKMAAQDIGKDAFIAAVSYSRKTEELKKAA